MLIGQCMNPQKQDMKILLFMLPRIWNVEGRAVGVDLGLGRFQFNFELEEDIVEVRSRWSRSILITGWCLWSGGRRC